MKILLDKEDSIFNPPQLGCVLSLTGLPGGGNKIYDRSPYGDVGTITGAIWKCLPSGLWYLDFDGSDDFINCGSILSDWNTDWTIEIWASLLTGVPAYAGLIGNRFGTGAANWITLGTANNTIRVEIGPVTPLEISSGYDARDAGWVFYDVVNKDDTVTLCINLENKGSTDVSSKNLGGSNNNVYLGRWYDADQIWKGPIGIVRIYNRALSAFEIRNHFNREKHLFGVW